MLQMSNPLQCNAFIVLEPMAWYYHHQSLKDVITRKKRGVTKTWRENQTNLASHWFRASHSERNRNPTHPPVGETGTKCPHVDKISRAAGLSSGI
jgi:hypothetical protein